MFELTDLLAQASAPASTQATIDYSMQPLGWTFMTISLLTVLALTIFCFARVLAKPSAANHMHSPIDIDTGDEGT